MPENDVINRAQRDARQGKAPSTQAGEFGQLAPGGGELRQGIERPRRRFGPKVKRSYYVQLEKPPRHALTIETQGFMSRIGIGFATTSCELLAVHGVR